MGRGRIHPGIDSDHARSISRVKEALHYRALVQQPRRSNRDVAVSGQDRERCQWARTPVGLVPVFPEATLSADRDCSQRSLRIPHRKIRQIRRGG